MRDHRAPKTRTLKSSLQKLWTGLQRGFTRSPAKGDLTAKISQSTGETVYGDRPLRLRNLSISEPDVSAIVDPGSLADGFKIRLAKVHGRKRDAGTLIERRYGSVGYSIPSLSHDSRLSTFIAYDEGTLVGTVALRVDSPEKLSADELYGEELDRLRDEGARLCEFTRLAVDRSAASKPVLAGLFHTAYLYAAVIRGCTHAVIEVTPQHALFYHRALRFDQIGSRRLNPRVNTEGVLMCVPFAAIAEGLATYAGKPEKSGALRSLFVYGFPPEEEAGVLNRLQHLIQAP